MPRTAPSMRRLLANAILPKRPARLDRMRVHLGDGAATTLHVVSYERRAFAPRVVVLEQPAPLVRWCREHAVGEALVGGFFIRAQGAPLGELRIGGATVPSIPFAAPWGAMRASLHASGEQVRIARRDELPEAPPGDLLQAGPLLVRDGCPVTAGDAEGFSAGSHQFDSDITAGRYPRAAFALAGERMLAVACDGRTRRDAGMTLAELAEALVRLGATDALNLDGGGSTSLIHGGRLRNRPREEHGVDLLEGRPIVTAVVFQPR
jgi:hypothetical protein